MSRAPCARDTGFSTVQLVPRPLPSRGHRALHRLRSRRTEPRTERGAWRTLPEALGYARAKAYDLVQRRPSRMLCTVAAQRVEVPPERSNESAGGSWSGVLRGSCTHARRHSRDYERLVQHPETLIVGRDHADDQAAHPQANMPGRAAGDPAGPARASGLTDSPASGRRPSYRTAGAGAGLPGSATGRGCGPTQRAPPRDLSRPDATAGRSVGCREPSCLAAREDTPGPGIPP